MSIKCDYDGKKCAHEEKSKEIRYIKESNDKYSLTITTNLVCSICKHGRVIVENRVIEVEDEIWQTLHAIDSIMCEKVKEIKIKEDFNWTANYPKDVDFIVKAFKEHNIEISEQQAEYIWYERSDNWAASWLDTGSSSGSVWFELCTYWAYVDRDLLAKVYK